MYSTEPSTAMLLAELLMLKTRYDYCAFSPAIYAIVKNIETEVSWIEHKLWERRAVAPTPYSAGRQQTGVTNRAR
jgi:hypothetical protein